MATQIIPFDSVKLPAHLRGAKPGMLDDLFAGTGGGFPVMSIKGKVFAIRRGAEKQVLTRPDDDDTPAASVDVVLLRAQPGKSKTFYLKGYVEGEDARPDCTSSNGVEPDAGVPSKQAEKCALCKHNQWGSKISESGKELKACQDNKRLAIAAPGQLNDPMLLRVPPASFKALDEYAKLLKTRGVDYNQVLTKVSFVMDAATPQLKFRPVGFLDEAGYTEASELFHSDLVQQIIGMIPVEEGSAAEFEAPETAKVDTDMSAAVEQAEQAVTKAKAEKTAAKPKAEPKAEPKVEAKPKAEPKAEVVEVAMDDALEAALAEIDGLNFDD